MSNSATAGRVSSGVPSYDVATWRGNVPDYSHVRDLAGVSTVMQCRPAGPGLWMETDVPGNDNGVLIFRSGFRVGPEARIGGQRFSTPYAHGDAVFLAPGTDSHWRIPSEAAAGWFHVHFAPAMLARAETELGGAIGTRPWLSDPVLTRLGELVRDLAGRDESPNPLVWESLANLILWRLVELLHGRLPFACRRGGLAPWQARRTMAYLADNLERRVSLSELAEVARLSPFHFARAFAQTVGMPPYRYQQKLRLERAGELLARSDLRVIDVALAVGYESPQALARVFARAHGLSPSQWRARHQEA